MLVKECIVGFGSVVVDAVAAVAWGVNAFSAFTFADAKIPAAAEVLVPVFIFMFIFVDKEEVALARYRW